MNYHITITLNREVKRKNLTQLRNISKHYTEQKATVVKQSPKQAVVKLNASVNRNQARRIAKRLKNARGYKRLDIAKV